MISDFIRGDILDAPEIHVAFAIKAEGRNTTGLAQQVSTYYWHQLEHISNQRLGEVLTHKDEDKTFHALVCYSDRPKGWEHTAQYVEQCLELVIVPKYEPIAIALMGADIASHLRGVHVYDILGAIARSPKRFVVYRRF